MSRSNDPAFPIPGYVIPLSDGPDGFKSNGPSGLTKRELFAALAMQGMVHDSRPAAVIAAGWAVDYADALIVQLEKPSLAAHAPKLLDLLGRLAERTNDHVNWDEVNAKHSDLRQVLKEAEALIALLEGKK